MSDIVSDRPVSRRTFLAATAGVAAALAARPGDLRAAELDFPLVDLHVHRDNSTLEQILPLGTERGVKFGIVEHAGDTENQYPVVLSNDEQLLAYLKTLDGKGCYKGIQCEWITWSKCFSKDALAKLDYTLGDAMTFPDKAGKRTKLWLKEQLDSIDLSDKQAFMDRFVEWHEQVIATQPLDVFANTSWLPAPMMDDYETYWTQPRIKRVVDAAVKFKVALEISASYHIPKLRFLQIAKEAGVKFTFGSNGRFPKMGLLHYSIDMARELGLRASDMFLPAPDGQKAVQRRLG